MGYKTKKEEEAENALYAEGYPKSLYHKDFDSNGDEKNLLKHHKVVKTEAEEKRLGADWDVHPSLKSEKKEAEVLDEKPKAVKTKVKLD